LNEPGGVAVDAAGDLYIADTDNSRIRKVAATTGIITTVAGNGAFGYSGDGGPATSADLNEPGGVAVDAAGDLYIADTDNSRIRKVAATTGIITTVAGNGTSGYSGDGGPGTSAELNDPFGVAVDAAGNLYIADTGNYRIRTVAATTGIVTTLAGNAPCYLADVGPSCTCYSGDGGPATSAQLNVPAGTAEDAAGNLYIADTANSRIRKVAAATGIVTTVAGNGAYGYSGDGGPATSAQLNFPPGVAADSGGNLYIADYDNARIRKVAAATGIITTVAGNGTAGYSGDGGPATSAQLNGPFGAAVDAAGNLYIDDEGNGRIRKVAATSGIITTVAGNGTAGYSGDGGPATSAQLDRPSGAAVDAAGNLYIADEGNNRIRKVAAAGIITTVAGNGAPGYSGDGGLATSAELSGPTGVAADSGGNVYIVDASNARIRKVAAATGIITTVAGNGTSGSSGDGGPATSAQFERAEGVSVDAAGNVYVADILADVVRMLVPVGTHALLNIASTHSSDFAQGQTGASYSVVVSNAASAATTSGTVTVTEILPGGLTLVSMSGTGWSCSGDSCTRSDALAAGSSYPPVTVTVNVAADAPSQVVNEVSVSGGGSVAISATDLTTVLSGPPPAPVLTYPANGAIGALVAPTLFWNPSAGATSYDVYFGTSSTPPYVANTTGSSYAPGALSQNTTYYWQIVALNSAGSASSETWSLTTGVPPIGLLFIPVTPCRVADTRSSGGPFGGPTMTAGSTRSFAIPQSACSIPSTALAYSLNVTVVSAGPLGYLSLWPTGQAQPYVSTLNSPGGLVVANAALVPAGSGGAVSVYVSDETDVILDINGYFAATSGTTSYSFYPAPPCRIADTRNATGEFGGPSMFGGQVRNFPIPVGPCSFPPAARAYSLNVTVVPDGPLGYLTTWPTGQAQPFVSTLNSETGKIVANAALVPAGTNESISVYVTDPTDVILDGNGYFAAPGSLGALTFYPVTPCRVADTRNADGPFGGPELAGGSTRSFTIPASGCNIPSTAAAYSLNVTVVPSGVLYYLTAWPTGLSQPLVSTLNSFDGSVVANAAIVPAGTNGAVSIYVTNPTQVILDINGYFAP